MLTSLLHLINNILHSTALFEPLVKKRKVDKEEEIVTPSTSNEAEPVEQKAKQKGNEQ